MKIISVQSLQENFKISRSFALEIAYSDFLTKKKIYTKRGNYSARTLSYLSKKFDAVFEYGNDAPRGGKRGSYAIMISHNELFDNFCADVLKKDEEIFETSNKRNIERKAAIEAMVISEEDKIKFLQKTQGISNKQKRKIAHNFAGRILGFYSAEGMEKFLKL